MNREANAAIQPQPELKPHLIEKAGTEADAPIRDSATIQRAGESKDDMLKRSLTATLEEKRTMDMLDEISKEAPANDAELDIPVTVDHTADIMKTMDGINQGLKMEMLTRTLHEAQARRKEEQERMKANEAAMPFLDAINAEADAHQAMLAEERDRADRLEAIIAEAAAERSFAMLDALNEQIDLRQEKLAKPGDATAAVTSERQPVAPPRSMKGNLEAMRAADRKREIDAIIAEAAAERAAKQRFEAVAPVMDAVNAAADAKDLVLNAPIKEFAAAIKEASSPANVEKNFTAGMSDAEKNFFAEGDKVAEAPDAAGYVEKKVTTYDETGAPEKRVDQWIKSTEAANLTAKNELSKDRQLQAAQELVSLKESEAGLAKEMEKAEHDLEASLGMSIEDYTAQVIKSPLASMKTGFRSLFDRDLRNNLDAYNAALEKLQEKQDSVKILELAISNPLEAARLASHRVMSKLRRGSNSHPERPRILT